MNNEGVVIFSGYLYGTVQYWHVGHVCGVAVGLWRLAWQLGYAGG